jgi:hypothetical protein
VAGPAGTLLVLDDVQWAGEDALDLLRTLLRSAERPLRVVGAYRSSEVRPPDPLGILAADLARDHLLARALVGPLAPEEAAGLLRAVLERDGEEWAPVGQSVTRCGGVPFYLISCARALRAGAPDGEVGAAVPWDVAQSVRVRVATLPDAARELLGMAAVAGRDVSGALLAGATDSTDVTVAAALEAACQAQLLVDGGGDRYRFAHDLIREVVEADLSSTRRRALHRAVAQALARDARESSPALLAYHCEQAGDHERAVAYLERAAERAAGMGAYVEARDHVQRAIALAPAQEQARLYERLGDVALRDIGYGAYRAALGHWRRHGARDPAVGARVLRKLLFACIRCGAVHPRPSDEELVEMQAQARRLADAIDDEGERWRLRVAASFPAVWSDPATPEDASAARTVALAAAAYFETHADWESFSAVLDAYSGLSLLHGAFAEVIEVARRRLGAPDLSAMERGDAFGNVAHAMFNLGDYGRCLATMREALAQVRPGETLETYSVLFDFAAHSAWLSGRWDEVDALLEVVEGLPGKEMLPRVYLAALFVALAREDESAASGAATMVERLAGSELGADAAHVAVVRALLQAYRRDDPTLVALDPAHRRQYDTSFTAHFCISWALMFLCERGVTAPDVLLDWDRAMPVTRLAIAEALAAADDARLAAAIDDAEAHGLAPHAARMRVVLARRTGDRTQLERARPVLERLGDRQFLRRLADVEAALPWRRPAAERD